MGNYKQNDLQLCKFEHLRFGQPEDISYTTPSEGRITSTRAIRGLGITISESLQFTNHIKNMFSKVKQISGWIRPGAPWSLCTPGW